MPADLRIEGQQQLHEVYKELKRVGDTELRKQLNRAIRESTKPMKDAVKASALDRLPKRGGLAQLIANSKITSPVKKGSQTAGVTIKATNQHDVAAMNKGNLRHKVWGKAWAKKTQQISAGWFSDPIEARRGDVQKSVEGALQEVARQLKN